MKQAQICFKLFFFEGILNQEIIVWVFVIVDLWIINTIMELFVAGSRVCVCVCVCVRKPQVWHSFCHIATTLWELITHSR
jgi:hypothetical protein